MELFHFYSPSRQSKHVFKLKTIHKEKYGCKRLDICRSVVLKLGSNFLTKVNVLLPSPSPGFLDWKTVLKKTHTAIHTLSAVASLNWRFACLNPVYRSAFHLLSQRYKRQTVTMFLHVKHCLIIYCNGPQI